jgi:DNA-binding cell septation regulator SpoVG
MANPKIHIRSWVKGSDDDIRRGLLGFLSFDYGQFVIDGVTLRRTAQGKLTLSYPARTDRSGRRHAYIRPVDDEIRQAIEADVLGELVKHEGHQS